MALSVKEVMSADRRSADLGRYAWQSRFSRYNVGFLGIATAASSHICHLPPMIGDAETVADHVCSLVQMSIFSAISIASSTSMPR